MAEAKRINIKIRQDIFKMLREHLLNSDGDNESACYLYCHESINESIKTYIPHIFIPIGKEDFEEKGKAYLKIKLDVMHNVYVDFLMDKDSTCLISCHSHPFDTSDHPFFSSTDDENDRTQATWFYNEWAKFQDKYKKEGVKIEFLHLVLSQKGLNIRKYNVQSQIFEYIEKVTVFSDEKVSLVISLQKQ